MRHKFGVAIFLRDGREYESSCRIGQRVVDGFDREDTLAALVRFARHTEYLLLSELSRICLGNV